MARGRFGAYCKMSNSEITDDEKWKCDRCTYLNYPSSQRCVLCRCVKSGLLVAGGKAADASNNSNAALYGARILCKSQDIYDLAPPPKIIDQNENAPSITIPMSSATECAVSSTANTGASNADFLPQKWACEACTFLNWPKALKCTQCQTIRNKVNLSSEYQIITFVTHLNLEKIIGNANENLSSKSGHLSSVSSVTPNANIGKEMPQKSQSASPSIATPVAISNNKSPPSPDYYVHQQQGSSNGAAHLLLDSRIIAKKLQKWSCEGCTYENWPKTSKCVMCYTPRRPLINVATSTVARQASTPQSPGSPAPGTSTSSPLVEGNDKKRSLSSGKDGGRKSPKSDNCTGGAASSSTESVNCTLEPTTTVHPAVVDANTIAAAPVAATRSTQTVVVTSVSAANDEAKFERHLRRLRRQLKDVDYLWLNGIRTLFVDGLSDADAIEAFIAAGGDIARPLSQAEAHLLNSCFRSSRFECGHTLVHLAIKHHREDLLSFLLVCTDQPPMTSRRVKKVPCHLSPDAAADIRRQVAMSLRQRKGDMSCYFFTDLTTFCLPSSIYELPPSIQERLFDELLDRDVQKELEEEYAIINWSVEVTERLNSRLFALWNRTAGDCLLDSVLQATWGVFDSENSLRQALSDSLSDAANVFYPRWREFETYTADLLQYTIDEDQFARDWDLILQIASKPGSALEQVHIFALAHIIRRPIIVYGVRIVKSFRGESIDYARFEGLYLPLLWEPSFCWRSPVCLGYTRGHFCGLVPIEPEAFDYVSLTKGREFSNQPRYTYLPLQDADGQMLPLHFLNNNEDPGPIIASNEANFVDPDTM
uniref:ubiquitinyl hydrolase 1 n=1 Tax=Romanomermis culicivorax TaxID=13658 RepID=A0A915J1V5_ROMCU